MSGYLGELAFGGFVLVLLRPEGSDVHLLGLFSHVLLVFRHSLHDEEIRVDDGEQRQEIYEDGIDQDVGSAEPVLGEVVSSASSHVALRNIPEN